MKKLALLFLPVVIWFLFSFSQKKERQSSFEGIITYSVLQTPDQASGPDMGTYTSILLYVKGNMTKEIDNGIASKQILIKNLQKPENIIILEEFMGHKYLKTVTAKQKINIKKQDSIFKATVHLIATKETKEILGYKCLNVITKDLFPFNNDTIVTTYYYTIKFPDYMHSFLPGLPLEFGFPTPSNPKTVYIATSIVKQSLPDSTFITPSGYKPVTEKEYEDEEMRIMQSK
jgi:hypothetical protein